jgi:uncharacterized protein (DUF58 family)
LRARIYWAALVLALLFFALVTASPIMYTLLFALLAVPLVGFGASIFSVRRLSGGVRRLSPSLQVGDTLQEEITLKNLHWFPKLLLEAEHQTTPFGTNGRVLTLWPYSSASWVSTKHCERRGLYRFGKLRITSRDPLGLFNRKLEFGEDQVALIFPATVDLPGFFVPSGHGWTEGLVRGRTFTPSPVASTVRDYVQGDSVAQVHWPATAHRGKLMVKEFEREPSGPADAVWVLIDLDARVQGGEGAESSVEYSVTIAGSVAKRFLDAGRTLGLMVNGEEQTIVRPGTGLEQMGRVFQALALAETGRLGTVLDAANMTAIELTRGASVVIVSSASPSDVAAAGRVLEGYGAGVVPIIVESASFKGAPPARGGSYRLPGTAFDAYVIHAGDEIAQRLDYRVHGHRNVAVAHETGR